MLSKNVLFTQLTGCSGCLMAILGLEIFKDLMEVAKVDFFPFLCDSLEKEYNFTFVEGCSVNDERQLMELRSNTEILVALGSCAVLGGITSLSEEYPNYPLKEYVDVDYEIPGCPPPPLILGRGIMNILAGKSLELDDRVLCYSCKYAKQIIDTPHISKIIPVKPPNSCFLKEGVLCMGPIARGGCEALCIDANIPCEGCTGSPSNYIASTINMLSTLSVTKEIREYNGLYFRFSNFKRK
ncbi:MAG: hypothetical protein JSV05_08980 [Candidatus Bathyarchaeota archaeon]|nr:MAG: hypothetical protein JSV05_08980 [Candidatus Bathyarchaeota archaeon]